MLSRTLDGLLALFDNRTLAFDGDAALRDAVATFSVSIGSRPLEGS